MESKHNNTDNQSMIDVKEVAQRLGRPLPSVNDWIKKGELHAEKGKGGKLWITEEEFKRFKVIADKKPRRNKQLKSDSGTKKQSATNLNCIKGTVQVTDLQLDDDVQIRIQIDQKLVLEYAEKMSNGDRFPPIEVFQDDTGVIFVADGFHRAMAAKEAGVDTLPANIHHGKKLDAIKFALSANIHHGLRRTSKDKQKALQVGAALFPEISNNKLADLCGVSESSVRNWRFTFAKNEPESRVGKDGKTYPSRNQDQDKEADTSKNKSPSPKEVLQIRKRIEAFTQKQLQKLRTWIDVQLALPTEINSETAGLNDQKGGLQ